MERIGRLSVIIGQGGVLCKEEELFRNHKRKSLFIGIPNEQRKGDNRVCLTPETVRTLVDMGHKIIVQRGAGEGANYTDREYCDCGARIVETLEEVYVADIILKVTSVSVREAEYMHEHQVILSSMKVFQLKKEAIVEMMRKKVTALGFDIIKDDEGYYPIVRIMSEIAGNAAIMIAGEYLNNSREGKGIILGGVSGITPTEVMILGAGTLGEYAARAALGLGATVKVFDASVNRLRQLREKLNGQVYTSVFHEPVVNKSLLTADVVIGAVRCLDKKQAVMIREEQVKLLKRGAVIVDLSVDQGGCIETSYPTTHAQPVYTYEGVIHYCVPNVLSRVAKTASIAYSNVLLPLLSEVADLGGFTQALRVNAGLRNGVYIYNGILTKEVLADRFELMSKDIDLLLAAL
ncbi:alanine dehydrogenase [Odoribacter lunatus]|uniref:alanine dehydrogenase n=1 Tax=Odoribacter lunatus TaxID=2941335 RepID=UPI0020406B95|nr:alanine dehydrogenase [Odoribacter lunatus]